MPSLFRANLPQSYIHLPAPQFVAEPGASEPRAQRDYESCVYWCKASWRWSDVSELARPNARALTPKT